MRLIPIVPILVLLAALEGGTASAPVQPGDGTAASLGYAFALNAGTPAYTEEHEERYAGGRLQSMKTLYKHGQGAVLAAYSDPGRGAKGPNERVWEPGL